MAVVDTWLKEFEEAMRLADEISGKRRERQVLSSSGGDPSHLIASTRRKITQLGTCLDRLESLLQNPPEKPKLDEEEIYRRQEMLLGVRLKTKQMASSFSTSPSNRGTTLYSVGEDSTKRTVEPISESNATFLPPKQATITRQQAAVDSMEDSSLHTRLLDSEREIRIVLMKGDGDTESKKLCSSQLICLIILGVILLLLLVWTMIRIW